MPGLMNRRQWLKAGATAATGLAIRPYLSPDQGLSPGPIRLHSNENPYGPSLAAREAMTAAFAQANLYPFETYLPLERLIAEREGLTPEHVVLGAGSHEVLRMTAMAYGLAGGEVITAYPTYEGMERYARSIGAHVHRVPLDRNKVIDLQEMERRITQGVQLVFVCNPNNPTGTICPSGRLNAFCEEASRRAVVLVDEAYYELVDSSQYQSAVPMVAAGRNIIVSRTFSKAYGLAGLRVGYALARPDIAARLREYRTVGSVNIMGLRAAIASYTDKAFVSESRAKISRSRNSVTNHLQDLGYSSLPAHANFIFFRLGRDIEAFQNSMEKRGILVGRPFPPYLDWCRLSIGTNAELTAFAQAFEVVMSTPHPH